MERLDHTINLNLSTEELKKSLPVKDLEARTIQVVSQFLPKEENIDKTNSKQFIAFTSDLDARASEVISKVLSTKENIDESVNQFISQLNKDSEELIDLTKKINFSRGYENGAINFPTTEEMKPLVDLLKEIQKQYSKFAKQKGAGFKKSFIPEFKNYLKELENCIVSQALISRRAQLEKLLGAIEEESTDYFEKKEFQIPVIEAQIEALIKKPGQYLLELRDILNLRENIKNGRKYTRDELEMFKFLMDLDNLLRAQK